MHSGKLEMTRGKLEMRSGKLEMHTGKFEVNTGKLEVNAGKLEIARSNFSEQRTPISLLQGKGELTIECAGNVPKTLTLHLNVISPKIAGNLRIGKRDETSFVQIPIPAGRMKDGWHEIETSLQLGPGQNVVELIPDGPLVKFGRRETRLLVDSELSMRAAVP